MTDRDLILHIGHGKTGSTYLQALLTHNAVRLADLGIVYPVFPRPGEDVLIENWHERHSFGNAQAALDLDLSVPAPTDTSCFVLSAEELVMLIFFDKNDVVLAKLKRFCRLNKITRVRAILMVRDPIAVLVSGQSQLVTNQGRVAEFLSQVLVAVRRFLETELDLPGYTREVYNYSRRSHDMNGVLSGILGVPEGTLQEPVGRDTNRSLAAPEYEFVHAARALLGEQAKLLAIAIKANVPKPKYGAWVPPVEQQKRLIDDNREVLDAINAALPEAERYRFEYLDPSPDAACYELDSEWITKMGRAVGFLLHGPLRELKANQAQVELLTASRDIMARNWDSVSDALTRADQHIAELSRIESANPERSDAMAETAAHLRAQLSSQLQN